MRAALPFAILLAVVPGAALAGFNVVPEPGSFELLALSGLVAAVIALRNRRK
jgi:hypothetical protein